MACRAAPGSRLDDCDQPLADRSGDLVELQSADGSFEGDVARTAASVLALLLLGHTRRKGTRRRILGKAAKWLAGHRDDVAATLALSILERVEMGGRMPDEREAGALFDCGPEGRILAEVLQQVSAP